MKPQDLDHTVSMTSNDFVPRTRDESEAKGGLEEFSQAESSDSGEEGEEDNDNYMDLENDAENIKFVSLFDNKAFDNVLAMLAYVRSSYNFDLAAVQNRFGLDLLETIKLVNFVRHEVKEGRGKALNISNKTVFEDDRYLQPVLEDDALLFSLEDIVEDDRNLVQDSTASTSMPSGIETGSEAYSIIHDLRKSLLESQEVVIATQQRLELAERALKAARELDTKPLAQSSFTSQTSAAPPRYEGNYDGAELHRDMLADKARTETYRNFILNNPQLFKDKIVLDVGCGTSILSLFCADAGAKVVYAVDQSEKIINKAQEIVFRNGKQDIVKLFHGRIQDIHLPVPKVDIIVSEWMGYCLLFEAMFDSVLWARDKYLKPNGLMVPAQSTLYIAPFSNPQYRRSTIDFWDDVYGYDMSCFRPEVLKTIDTSVVLNSSHLVSAKEAFQTFNHYEARVNDLSFRDVPFSVKLNRDITQLDGFAIWFDVTFIAPNTSPATAFTRLTLSTGPEDIPTHWHQGVCLIDQKERKARTSLVKDVDINGLISFEKEGEGKEGLDIKISWKAAADESGEQKWILR